MADNVVTLEKVAQGTKGPEELLPPEGKGEKVAIRVFEILKEIIDHKEALGLPKRWNRNYELKRGKHWKNASSTALPLVTANLIHVNRLRTINVLTDNSPIFNVARLGDTEQYDEEAFDDIQRCADHWWNEQEQQDVFESSVNNGEDYGIAIEKVVFNPDLEESGEVDTIVVDPFHFGFYPVSLTNPRDLQKSEAVLHYYPLSLREAKRRWPKYADRIKGDDDILKELSDERTEVAAGGRKTGSMLTTFASTVQNLINFNMGKVDEKTDKQVLIVEAWVHDYTMIKRRRIAGGGVVDPQIELATIEEVVVEEIQPKYPGFIRYVVCCNGKLTLEDRPNPNINPSLPEEEARKTYLWDKFPFAAANSHKDTASAWGMSDAEQLERLNTEFDKAISQFVLMKDRAARAKIINPRTSGVQNIEFTNDRGIINPINAEQGAGIRYLDYPAIPADIQASISLFQDLFFRVAGTFDLDIAKTSANNTLAYKSIAALIEQAATMMRGKIRNYSRLIRERGRMYVSMAQNFYTEERWITYKDASGNQVAKSIVGKDLLIPARLTVVAGSTMPRSQIQVREEAMELFRLGAIDRQELLGKLDWPSRTDVVERMNAGPYVELFGKLQAAGLSPKVLQTIQQIAGTEKKDIARAVEKGALPPLDMVLQQMYSGQPAPQPPPDPEAMVAQAEVELKMAEARRTIAQAEETEAKKALTAEQIMTERVKQQVALAGTKYDEELLKIKRAEVVAKIEADIKQTKREALSLDIKEMQPRNEENKGIYHEKGAASNNQEVLE